MIRGEEKDIREKKGNRIGREGYERRKMVVEEGRGRRGGMKVRKIWVRAKRKGRRRERKRRDFFIIILIYLFIVFSFHGISTGYASYYYCYYVRQGIYIIGSVG